MTTTMAESERSLRSGYNIKNNIYYSADDRQHAHKQERELSPIVSYEDYAGTSSITLIVVGILFIFVFFSIVLSICYQNNISRHGGEGRRRVEEDGSETEIDCDESGRDGSCGDYEGG